MYPVILQTTKQKVGDGIDFINLDMRQKDRISWIIDIENLKTARTAPRARFIRYGPVCRPSSWSLP